MMMMLMMKTKEFTME